MSMKKKCVWTLVVGDYNKSPILKYTLPLMRNYAHKIGADFKIITERKFPEYDPVYEKLQIYELGKDYDWNIFFDADALVSPNMFDFTEFLHDNVVMHWNVDFANIRFASDDYFRRDGRNIGTCGWFWAVPKNCLDAIKPSTMTPEELNAKIFPTDWEASRGLKKPHYQDDFVVSQNIARYGLQHVNFNAMCQFIPGLDSGMKTGFINHTYACSVADKIKFFKLILDTWSIDNVKDYDKQIINRY